LKFPLSSILFFGTPASSVIKFPLNLDSSPFFGHAYAGKDDDPDCFIHSVLESAAIAKAENLPFFLSEYMDCLQGGPGVAFGGPHADTAYNR
tara:strand:+ start:180 stop:455 length:276 start_codon:yes stop_codon:yes gene_type:complete